MEALVKDVMAEEPLTILNKATIGEAVKLFAKNDVDGLVVVNDTGDIVAFLSDGDIISYVVRNVQKRNLAQRHIGSWEHIDSFQQYLQEVVDEYVYECATPFVISIESDATVKAASRLLKRKHLKVIPVIDDGTLVGLISRRMIMRGMFNEFLADSEAEGP